jgi:hypothetical protein
MRIVIELDPGDATCVAHSLRAIAHSGKPGGEASAIYYRVGCALLDGVQAALEERNRTQLSAEIPDLERRWRP